MNRRQQTEKKAHEVADRLAAGETLDDINRELRERNREDWRRLWSAVERGLRGTEEQS